MKPSPFSWLRPTPTGRRGGFPAGKVFQGEGEFEVGEEGEEG